MAYSSSSGGADLSRNPLAPARSAANAYSSRSKVVRMRTPGAFGGPADLAGRGHVEGVGPSVGLRHHDAEVMSDHVV
jgi:hypothetical protein